MPNRIQYSTSDNGGTEMELLEVGPVPAWDWHFLRYITKEEAKTYILKDGEEIRPHPMDNEGKMDIVQLGEWMADVFEPKLRINTEQLEQIPKCDQDQWEKDDWVVVTVGTVFKIEKDMPSPIPASTTPPVTINMATLLKSLAEKEANP